MCRPQDKGKQNRTRGDKTMATTTKLRWAKCPAVRKGGKPYFYFTHTPQGKRWVVWDRNLQSWIITDESKWDTKKCCYVNNIHVLTKSAQQGKQLVESGT